MSTDRTLRRFVALLVLAVVVLGSAAPAAAAGSVQVPQLPIPGLPECRTPPVPQSPDRGFGGFITPRPADPPALDADPFATDSGVGVYETTGLAGYRWHMYVDSCLPGPGQATNAALTSTANSLQSLPVLAVGVVATLADAVYNQTWLDVLDRPVAHVSDALYDGFTRPFFPVLAVAVGVVMVVGIRRAKLSAAIGTGCLVLVAATLAAFAANYPSTVADVTDRVTSTAIVSVNGAIAGSDNADPATATVSPLVDAILYDRWVAGTLGDSTSPTARQYGPELYQASTLTWAETGIVRADPDGAGAELIEAKQKQWREAADAVESSDPDAYEYLTGARSLDRVGHALVSLALVGILPFLLMSLLLVAMSYLIIRLVVMFLPLVALVALLLRGTLRSLATLAAAALINSVVFAVGAAVTAYLYGVFLSPDSGIPALLGILLAFVVGIAMWIVLSPYRRLTTMVRGGDAVTRSKAEYGRVKKGTTDFASGAGRVALGVFAGKKAADATDAAAQATRAVSGATTATSERYRIGPNTIRPEHLATAAPPPGQYRPATGPPAELGAAPSLAAIAPPGVAALPGPREPASATSETGEDPAPRHRTAGSAIPMPTSAGEVAPETSAALSIATDVDQPGRPRRPESVPLRDFDPVVVDGQSVTVIHTLDGPVIDHDDRLNSPGRVVSGDVVTSRNEALP